MAHSGLLPALALLAFAGPAAAQSGAGALVCVNNQAGYVARITYEIQYSGLSWQRLGSHNIASDCQTCQRFASGATRTRTMAEGHTGFNQRRACQYELQGTQRAAIDATGTTLNQSCIIF